MRRTYKEERERRGRENGAGVERQNSVSSYRNSLHLCPSLPQLQRPALLPGSMAAHHGLRRHKRHPLRRRFRRRRQQFSPLVNGWNSYWLMEKSIWGSSSRSKVSKMLKMGAKMGLTVCRTWAFSDGNVPNALQTSPGVFNERVFRVSPIIFKNFKKFWF